MKEFSFTSEDQQNDIESILKERKQKIATQQIVFTAILFCILVIVALWIGKKILYTEFDGYINTDLNTIRTADDVYIHLISFQPLRSITERIRSLATGLAL